MTDADWATINELHRAYERKGAKGFGIAIEKLASDPIRYVRIMGAFFPDMIREAIRDSMAERGITPEDLEELIRKHERPARSH